MLIWDNHLYINLVRSLVDNVQSQDLVEILDSNNGLDLKKWSFFGSSKSNSKEITSNIQSLVRWFSLRQCYNGGPVYRISQKYKGCPSMTQPSSYCQITFLYVWLQKPIDMNKKTYYLPWSYLL